MTRRFKLDRPRKIEVQVPTSICQKVEEQLYSEIEGKIPFGARSNLVTELLTEWLRDRGVIV